MSVLGIVAGVLETLTELPQLYLTLGGVVFNDQEIPSSLSGGGDQMLGAHKYPGGVRTVDTFGPDDKDLSWGGTFLDTSAETRCHQLDSMRRQGLPLTLTWSNFNYLVLIRSFTWTYQRPWQIPYRMVCFVLQDMNFPPDDISQDATGQAQNDVAAASANAPDAGGPNGYAYPSTASGFDNLTLNAATLQAS
jgi:hypothetical protein